MTTIPTPSAKDRVLSWVRSKNPQTLELKRGCRIVLKNEDIHYIWKGERVIYDYCLDGNQISDVWCHEWKKYKVSDIEKIIGSDMGLQELLIAFGDEQAKYCVNNLGFFLSFPKKNEPLTYAITHFDLTKNLHNQSEYFYQVLLPLIPNE